MKPSNNKIEIPLNKKKLVYFLFIGILFLSVSILLIIIPEKFVSIIFRNELLIKIIGIAGTLFCMIGILIIIKYIYDNKKGLIINKKGIIDNSSGLSVGLIEWKEIKEIRKSKVISTHFLLIDVFNPEEYIYNIKSSYKQKLFRVNMNMYNTPLSISSNALKISFEDLEQLLQENFEKYKRGEFDDIGEERDNISE